MVAIIIIENLTLFIRQIKLSGACGLASALTCALVTVTTTVLHMSRLQALRECEYTRKTRTCTCYSIETGSLQDDGGIDESKFFGDSFSLWWSFAPSSRCKNFHTNHSLFQ